MKRPVTYLPALLLLLSACGNKSTATSSGTATAAAPTTAAPSSSAKKPGPPKREKETPDQCLTECAKDATDGKEFVCGTDHKTYKACEWNCDQMPAGVGMYPGECNADGGPQAKHPPRPADGKIICDWFDNKGQWIAVECEESTADTDSRAEFGGKGAMPAGGASLEAASTAAPDEVTHRARFGSIKNQGSAPSCISFASTAALEGAVASATSSHIVLSEMHFLSHYHTTSYKDAIATLSIGAALADNAKQDGMDYDASVADGWIRGDDAPPADKVKSLDEKIAFEVAAVREIIPEEGSNGVTAVQMQNAIADGDDLMVGFRMSDNWYTDNLLPGGIIEDYDDGRNFGHAVLLVGYKTIDGKKYFEVRNSWGTTWAEGGYGWISFETAEANLQVAAAVSAQRRSDVPIEDCKAGEAAGFDGKCAKLCASGALEQNGSCPEDTGCPDGKVKDGSNVCVRACATGTRDATEGISVDCKGEGCVWSIPGGSHGCKAAEGEKCEHYCRAPDCEMVESKNEFGVAVLGCGPAD